MNKMFFRLARTLRNVPLIGKLFVTFPVRIPVWYPAGSTPDGRMKLNFGRVEHGTVVSIDKSQYFLTKSDFRLVGMAGYEDFDMKNSTLHLIQIGRGNYVPLTDFEVRVEKDGSVSTAHDLMARAHDQDLFTNAYVLQQEMDNDRAPQKMTFTLMLVALGVILVTALGAGLVYYLANMISPFNLVCSCPVAIPSPVPPLVP